NDMRSTGIGVSGDVSLNGYGDANNPTGIHDIAQATINAGGSLSASTINVTADSTLNLYALAGAVAVARVPQGTNAALAGSYSQTTLDGTTKAVVQGAPPSTDQLTITATRTGSMFALTAGAAVATGTEKYTVGVAGSVSINSIADTTEALLEGLSPSLAG